MNQPYHLEKQEDIKSLKAFALDELKRQRKTSDIIEHLCQRTGWHWVEAEQFLESVRVDNSSQLEAHKNRLFILASLVMIVGGMLNIAIFCFWIFYNSRSGEFLIPNDVEGGILLLINQLVWMFVKSPFAYIFYFAALTGIGMIIGGMIGFVIAFWRAFILRK
ncbi:MAG: hypothetical protein JW908_15070 [Anaerolineales bacterium]|nr:hypothetical protein [Anaerolineales bacterium]